jgi:Tfp pilus assembly protein PilF
MGRYWLNKLSGQDYNKAIGYFEQAIAKDSRYALAYVRLANCYAFLGHDGYIAPKEAYPKARAGALKAVDLDQNLGEAHAMLGLIKHVFEWDVPGAELEFRHALELSPNSRDVYFNYSLYLAETRRFDEAIARLTHLKEIDPATPGPIYLLGCFGYGFAERYDEAIAEYNKALEMDPNFYYAHISLAYTYALKGMYAKAISQADRPFSIAVTITAGGQKMMRSECPCEVA